MDAIGNDRRGMVISIYEQHSAQIRHLEQQRLYFTAIYLVIWGAVLIFRHTWLSALTVWFGAAFMLLVSLFGFLFVLDLQRALTAHRDAADLVLRRYDLARYLPTYGQKEGRSLLSASGLVPLLFLVWLSVFILLFLDILLPAWAAAVVTLVVLCGGIILVALMGSGKPASDDTD